MEEGYLNFDEYIRQGEPAQREAAYAWSTAIGLQAVDGLKTSEYLNDLARKNIEGEISFDEVERMLNSYYQSKTIREPDDDEKQEADEVSGNISKLLQTDAFTYSVAGFAAIHKADIFSLGYLCDSGDHVVGSIHQKCIYFHHQKRFVLLWLQR